MEGGKWLREATLVGLGVLSMVRERIEAVKEELRKRGVEVLEELRERKEALKGRGEEERERLRERLRKVASLHPLFASKFELEELRKRVEALEGRAEGEE